MQGLLPRYRHEMQQELDQILDFWMTNTPDPVYGGFIGKIDHAHIKYPESPKGSVLNSRILWTFSAAFNLTGNELYRKVAGRAFDYLVNHFLDKEFGGVYWTVDYAGQPLDAKKQIYALSFAVYGLSEYYKASKDPIALQTAKDIYRVITKYSYEEKFGGYIEALARNWDVMPDLRLSAKDANERKSMNTHLHVLEGFSNLYEIWQDEALRKQIGELIRLFLYKIISAATGHLQLFFNDAWESQSGIVSYGHDIEAAWLIRESAEKITGDADMNRIEKFSLVLAHAAAQGLDTDGGLWYEYDGTTKHLIKEKHSWPQAEAMVGFFNAWQISGDDTYLQRSVNAWEFVKKYIHDKKNGEWFWGVKEDYSVMDHEDKVGIWKCPYHNSRACIEIIKRIDRVIDKTN